VVVIRHPSFYCFSRRFLFNGKQARVFCSAIVIKCNLKFSEGCLAMMKLSNLLSGISKIPITMDVDILGLSLDSRLVKPGDLFFACAGMNQDGREFIADAIKMGARVVLAEENATIQSLNLPIIYIKNLSSHISEIAARFYGNPGKLLKIMGVTGTNGKTSCTYYFAEVLKQLQSRCGIIGTLGNGLYGKIQPGNLTTPDAITVQKILTDFQQQGTIYTAMEVSSHSLTQGRVSAVPFTVGVFTNLTRDHLDYHGSMEAYGNAKKKLFTELSPQYNVINADDEFGRKLIHELTPQKKVYAYSINQNLAAVSSTQVTNATNFKEAANVADLKKLFNTYDSVEWITVDEVQLNHTGIHANVFTPWGKGEFQTHLIGQFNLSNILAVITTLCLFDIPLPAVLNALANLKPVPGRMETFGGKTKPLVIVDYSHTPDSLEKALLALRDHCPQKLYCVFGCGGNRDRGKRSLMATIAEKFANYVIVTDDNPRTEDPKQIVRDIMQGFVNSGTIVVQHDRAKAIRDVIRGATSGDCILIAGKGAEMYQQIGDEKIPFNDTEEVKKNLLEI
jgi:UDP-N-acetylmuramoyl-L-alanyl-D-glutamate--2,6-diaminopimelate ligase